MKNTLVLTTALVSLLAASCGREAPEQGAADEYGFTAPTETTRKANLEVQEELDLASRQDFEDARRGLIAADENLRILASDGSAVWDTSAYEFIANEAPASVNPSLWRQAQLNNMHGLFRVADRIYQLRGYDLSNMTLIKGARGWIVVDPLTAHETAQAAIEFALAHLGQRPITAILFTHSHIDHFGGVIGLLSAEGVEAEQVRIIAPEGFMEEATSENIIAGPAMSRRAMYMYGKSLPRSKRGHVDSGLGKSPAFGRFGLLEPTETIDHTPQVLEIDGIEFVFQHAPDTEAPAELTFYLPHAKAFHGAEVTSRNMHNIYTLRGARVRDALNWADTIDESISLFGGAEVYLASHHWPIWGNERIRTFLEQQRDMYKYIHDQTVRMFNQGMTAGEIADGIALPASLAQPFYNRGYYGTVRHNARAVYQAYLGWYDGNPARLDPLPPVESGRRYVALAGGAEAVLAQAGESFERGEYRWVAELLNHLVFAEPNNDQARKLLAATYDQLAYRAESGPWRDVYLSAAWELRHGPPEKGIDIALMEDILSRTPVSKFFDSMAVRLNGPKAEGVSLSINIRFSDLGESYLLDINNAVLHHRPMPPGASADATLTLTHRLFLGMLTGRAGLRETLFSDELEVDGSTLDLVSFFSLFDKPEGKFNIVTP